MISKPAYLEFYDTFARQQVGCIAHTSALMVGNQMIAGNFGLVWRNRFYGLIQSSDFENYRTYSPGNHLLVEIIRWCCENGVSLFDFSIGSETYKERWADNKEQLYRHRQALNLIGVLAETRQHALVGFKNRAHPQLMKILQSLRNRSRERIP
jgi:CelD/BcsL family acetyltransferase involved in cellulose biosynthesis